MSTTLDWRELAPSGEIHSCDCGYCEMGGEREPINWPTLVVARDGDVEYVSDRFMIALASHAPVPEGYEGPALDQGTKATDLVACLTEVTTEPPIGEHFRWSTIKAVEMTGWRLRRIAGHDSRVAIVTTDDTPIGVAIVSKHERDDMWDQHFTRPYEEPTATETHPEPTDPKEHTT